MSRPHSLSESEAAVAELAAAAFSYAERDWRVFPVNGKRPRLPHGLTEASADPEQVRAWWQRWPDAGVAIATGDGLLVLDVDGEVGADALHELEREHGELPETVRAETGGGGEHYYFSANGELRNTAGKLGEVLDTRGVGGYAVAPPSPHPSGRRYEWDVGPDEATPAPAPAWLLSLLATPPPAAAASSNGADPIPEGRRNAELASLAGTMRRRGLDEAAIATALRETNQTRCRPPLGEDEVDAIAASVCRYEPSELPERTDLGNGELFAALHGERLRHVREERRWLHWRGGRWRPDRTGEAQRAAKATARELLLAAANLEGDEQRRAVKWALTTQSESRLRSMLALAATEPDVVLAAEQLDADPWLLGCANGTLDLRSGELRESDPAELVATGTDVHYDPDCGCPRWLRFLEEIFRGDDELVGFVRRLVGYALCGDTREHVLVVCHGTGANGKTTLIETLKALLGELAATASFESFVRVRGDRGPRNDLARLHRSRLVVAAESGQGRRLDEATLKSLTGGDTIAARFLYGEHFEFKPAFKLWLVTNHRPRVDGGDDAIWRRLRLVPFEESFQGRADTELAATLEAELPGILAWAVEGCLEWQRHGLGHAEAVDRATREYREDEDVLGAFLVERCQLESRGEVTATALREAYEKFCEELGERPLAPHVLGRELARRGIHRGGAQRRCYLGVTVDEPR